MVDLDKLDRGELLLTVAATTKLRLREAARLTWGEIEEAHDAR